MKSDPLYPTRGILSPSARLSTILFLTSRQTICSRRFRRKAAQTVKNLRERRPRRTSMLLAAESPPPSGMRPRKRLFPWRKGRQFCKESKPFAGRRFPKKRLRRFSPAWAFSQERQAMGRRRREIPHLRPPGPSKPWRPGAKPNAFFTALPDAKPKRLSRRLRRPQKRKSRAPCSILAR